jgi:phenylpropionate dioxygenase-like ring-hydroxylating dioxygenase large terminal subunit
MTIIVPDLVRSDAVHRRVYTDADVFARELSHIFETGWIFVGHDSQIPEPGDLYATRIGRQPVMMIRHDDGSVKVLHNRCPHRGAQLVPDGPGHARILRCAYHGWTFRPDGRVRTMTQEGGYAGSCLTRDNPDASVRAAAHVGVYRGFVFAALGASVPPLEEWLGGVASSIDNMVDRAPAGRLEVTGGVLRYRHRCNWKLFLENLNDLLHPMVAHQSSAGTARQVAVRQFEGQPLPPELEILSPFVNGYDFFDDMGVSAFPHGHSYSGGNVSIHSAYSGIADYDAAMIAAYGEARTREIFSTNRHNTVIYPSLTLKGPIQTIRTIRPVAVDETIIESFTLRLVGAPDALLERSILYCNLINSSANLVGPDDHEAYQRLQSGLLSTGSDWVSHHRHLHDDVPIEGGGWRAPGTSDLTHRNQFRAWAAAMEQSL